MADVIPNIFFVDQADGNINFNTDEFKCCLVYYNPKLEESNILALQTYSNVATHEVANGNGYETSGVGVSTYTTVDVTTNDMLYMCSSPSWTVSGGEVGPFNYAVFYDTTVDNHIVYVYDFLKNYTVADGGIIKINIDSGGLMRFKRNCS